VVPVRWSVVCIGVAMLPGFSMMVHKFDAHAPPAVKHEASHPPVAPLPEGALAPLPPPKV
jgi:hypothetical protein